MSGVTDCYQPIERRLADHARAASKCWREFRNPVAIITKNHLVTRDIDLLGELAEHQAAAVNISITTLDRELAARHGAAHVHRRARGWKRSRSCAQAGVPVGVMVAPIIPGLTDHEIAAILEAAAEAGAQSAGYIVAAAAASPSRRSSSTGWRNIFRIARRKCWPHPRICAAESLNDPRFESRMRGEGIFAEQIRALFEAGCKRAGIGQRPSLSTAAFRRPNEQLSLL